MDQWTDHARQQARERATRIVSKAWDRLPADHKRLLEEVGAAQWTVVTSELGPQVHRLLRSAGFRGLSAQAQERLAPAVAVWASRLRVVVFNACHPALTGLSDDACEHFIARTAWHEWGHALSIVRCTAEDVAAGRRLLVLAPTAVINHVRAAAYLPSEYTHELVAETYATLVERHQQGEFGRPQWLNEEIYELVRRVTGWPNPDA